MVKYRCMRCGKGFLQKCHFEAHKNRKNTCENTIDALKQLVNTAIDEKLKKINIIPPPAEAQIDPPSLDYSSISKALTKKISKLEKKGNGIYFTPPKTIYENINYLEPYMTNVKSVLEPSCGSCEYILALTKKYSNIDITGLELNKTIFESIKHLENDYVKLLNENYLNYSFEEKYDLIIGNPPYFVMKKNQVDESYYDYFEGRPNIFILFLIKSLKLLNENGIISFVLPKNFLNCLYYDKTRHYIIKNFEILTIIECNDDYIETKQETIILVLQNKKPVSNNNMLYSISVADYIIFGMKDKMSILKTLYLDSKSLHSLGFNVNVGNVVWNQCKAELTDNKEKTLLIYSSDIANNKLEIKQYSNKQKKNYINKKGNTNPLLVINRGYGVGTYNFNYCIINESSSTEYLIENHLICIKNTQSTLKEDLIALYKKIIESFKNKKTLEFIKLYFGNNAINTVELCKILPIYDI